MSFTYRPTPVITLTGKTVGHDGVPLRRLPAGTMHGYTRNMTSPALNSIGRRTLRGNPWLVASGTMGSFLGQDDGSGLDFSSAFESPTLPSPGIVDAGAAPNLFDFGGAFSSPTIPISSAGAFPAAPDIGAPILPAGSGVTSLPAIPRPVAPIATPGVSAPIAAGTSLLSSITNLFKPTASATPMTAAQPGVYKATTVTPSWFGQSTLLPGIQNSTALIGGAAVLLVFAVVAGGGKKR